MGMTLLKNDLLVRYEVSAVLMLRIMMF